MNICWSTGKNEWNAPNTYLGQQPRVLVRDHIPVRVLGDQDATEWRHEVHCEGSVEDGLGPRLTNRFGCHYSILFSLALNWQDMNK